MARNFPESDWKLLRRLQPVIIGRFCEGVFAEIATLSSGSGTAHERYFRLLRLIEKRDKDLGRAFDNLRRTSAFMQMVVMRSLKMFTEAEFMQFSPETRASVEAVLSYSSSE